MNTVKIVLFLFHFFLPLYCFDTLDDAISYAQNTLEYPDIKIQDWQNPNYSDFHHSIQPSFFSSLAEKIGIYTPRWSIGKLKKLITKLTKDRELEGYTGRFIQKLTPHDQEQIFLFGDLCGAFHSFVRDLAFLKTQGIIDEQFIIKQGNYFIFNGNVADRGPLILETLSLVATLLDKNPNSVFYIRGIEDKQGWAGRAFENELTARAVAEQNEKIPYSSLFTQFFETLPLSLFVTAEYENSIQIIQFLPDRTRKELLFSEKGEVSEFLHDPRPLALFKLTDVYEETPKNIKIPLVLDALITAEKAENSYYLTQGFTQLKTAAGEAPIFASRSSPIGSHRRLYEFFNDAFVQITVNTKNEYPWNFTLFFQDVRAMNGFEKQGIKIAQIKSIAQKKDASSAVSPTKKQTESSSQTEEKKVVLTVGSTLDFSRGLRASAEQHRRGMEARLARADTEDVIRFRINFRDDEYTPEKTRALVEELIKDGITINLGPGGSPTLQNYLDLITEKKILVLFPTTGSPFVRDKLRTYLIHMRLCSCAETKVIFQEALDKMHATKFVVFYQNDAYGKGALQGILEEQKKRSISESLIVQIPYERNNVNFSDQVAKIKEANPDAIILLSTSFAARELLNLLEVPFLAKKQIFGISDLGDESFRKFIQERGLQCTLTSHVPDPRRSELPLVQKFRADMEAIGTPVFDAFALEGYIDVSLLLDMLQKTHPPYTNDALIATAEQYKNYSLDGFPINFNPEMRELSQSIWIYSGEGEWREVKIS